MKILKITPEEPKIYEGYIVKVEEKGMYTAKLIISPDAKPTILEEKTKTGTSWSIGIGEYDWIKAAKVDVPFNSDTLSWDWWPAKVRLTVTEKPEVESTEDNYQMTMKTHYLLEDLESPRKLEETREDFTNTAQVMSRRTLEGVLEKCGGRTYEHMTLVRLRQQDGTKEVLAFYANQNKSKVEQAFGHKVRLVEEIVQENVFGPELYFGQLLTDKRTGTTYEGQAYLWEIPKDTLEAWKAKATMLKELEPKPSQFKKICRVS